MAMLLKNSSGEPSGSWTMVWIGFLVVTLWLLISIVSKIGHFEIRPFSATEAMAYLTPLLTLYFGRRWTDAKPAAGQAPTSADTPADGS
jgi:hypothetical protein